MEDKKFIPKKQVNDACRLNIEKHFLVKHYDFLTVTISGKKLKCIGYCKPCAYSDLYKYEVNYTPSKHPDVYVKTPNIEYHEDIHMYPHDNSLCLYYPKDFSWTTSSHLYNTIIPWTHEWFLFYELYKIHGKWFHPSVPHTTNGKIKGIVK